MATTPEGKVKKKIRTLLKLYGVYQYWPVPSGYGESSLDCVGCHNGWFFGIEAKAPGKKPTARQKGTIANMQSANGAVFVIDGDAGLKCLEDWLLSKKEL